MILFHERIALMSSSPCFILSLCLSTFMLFAGSFSLAHAKENQALSGVSAEINRQQAVLSSQKNRYDQLQNNLKKAELTISDLAQQIKNTQGQQEQTQLRKNQLQKEIKELELKKRQQMNKLARLLQVYYLTQNSKQEELWLKNDEHSDRLSQYYVHLAKTRAQMIRDVNLTRHQLAEHETQLNTEQEQLIQLLTQLKTQHQLLNKQQQERRQTLQEIQKSMTGEQHYLAELQRNENRLKSELAKAAKRTIVPMNGLTQQQKKLSWPLQGKILHQFGEAQSGQVSWKGMVIQAEYGQAVKAVYSGTVVFAEYLRGYGLVILLDHGKGDMTLYGFNQSLMKKEGDQVSAGETLALAGDTGGQTVPALYFEIRRNSHAVNPKQWLKP